MKTEAEVFFQETQPFVNKLAETVNPQFCLNMGWNYEYLEGLLNKRDYNMGIADPNTKGPAIVIGSGPSLDECMPYLNKARETHDAPIFCTASQVWSLYYQGVTPSYVIQHDPWSRPCPVCNDVPAAPIDFKDNGECYCTRGHKIEGEMREDLLRQMNIHPWAPDIGCKVIAHPGTQPTHLHWKPFQERGEMYFNNFNPNIGPYTVRDLVRGQAFGFAGEKYRNLENKTEEAWAEMVTAFIQAPGKHEPQDTPMWMSVILFGEGNPRLKMPVRIAAPYCPSSTFQGAVLAYMKGYNPIYFVGYDLCHWKNKSYHHKFMYDGTDRVCPPGIPPGQEERKSLAGFQTDYVQVGEKYSLAGYVSKQFQGMYALPGIQIVEVIADGIPGNLEFYPRIDIERFAEGETKNVSQDKTAKKIQAIVRERKMGAVEGAI